MYTIFSCPKEFSSLFGVIQRNAINSWLNLRPTPKIILFGIEDDEIKKEFDNENITFLPIKDFNEYKTPFIDKIFKTAMSLSNTNTLCYVNSDIILFNDFSSTINILQKKNKFFGVGRRYNIEIDQIVKFDDENTEIKKYLSYAKIDSYTGSDYFIFDKNSIKNIPSFLIGRTCWDNWLMHYASKNELNLTDCTSDILCIHQKHDYSHIKTSTNNHYKGIEREHNFKQLGGIDKLYDIRDSNFLLKNQKLKKNYSIESIFHKFLRKTKLLLLKETLYFKKKSLINFFSK
jgi:hypothetical protein